MPRPRERQSEVPQRNLDPTQARIIRPPRRSLGRGPRRLWPCSSCAARGAWLPWRRWCAGGPVAVDREDEKGREGRNEGGVSRRIWREGEFRTRRAVKTAQNRSIMNARHAMNKLEWIPACKKNEYERGPDPCFSQRGGMYINNLYFQYKRNAPIQLSIIRRPSREK